MYYASFLYSKCVKKSKGHITIPFIFRFLKSKYKPEIVDMALIGVYPNLKSTDIVIPLILRLYDLFVNKNIDHIETNLILENNYDALNIVNKFDNINNNKKRRVYIKEIK